MPDLYALLDAQGRRDPHAEGLLLNQMIREEHNNRLPICNGTPQERFFAKLVFGVCDCWYWTGALTNLGYGSHARVLGEVRAHRFAYRLFHGEIPGGMCVLHTCDVRHCVNPEHLWLGTQEDNIRDMNKKGRRRSGPAANGEKNPMARLTREQVAEIRAAVAAGNTQRSQCARFGVSPMTVSRVVRGESWR